MWNPVSPRVIVVVLGILLLGTSSAGIPWFGGSSEIRQPRYDPNAFSHWPGLDQGPMPDARQYQHQVQDPNAFSNRPLLISDQTNHGQYDANAIADRFGRIPDSRQDSIQAGRYHVPFLSRIRYQCSETSAKSQWAVDTFYIKVTCQCGGAFETFLVRFPVPGQSRRVTNSYKNPVLSCLSRNVGTYCNRALDKGYSALRNEQVNLAKDCCTGAGGTWKNQLGTTIECV